MCETCLPFQKSSLEKNRNAPKLKTKQVTVAQILEGTGKLKLEGVRQVQEHASSACHKASLVWLMGPNEDEGDSLNHKQAASTSTTPQSNKRKSEQLSMDSFFNKKSPLNSRQPLVRKRKSRKLSAIISGHQRLSRNSRKTKALEEELPSPSLKRK